MAQAGGTKTLTETQAILRHLAAQYIELQCGKTRVGEGCSAREKAVGQTNLVVMKVAPSEDWKPLRSRQWEGG